MKKAIDKIKDLKVLHDELSKTISGGFTMSECSIQGDGLICLDRDKDKPAI